MTSAELREKFLQFFKKNGHKIVPSSSLQPSDQSVLFTTAGMQQFKPYYLGEKSPYGKNVASCQKCIRTSDIDEVGDESHLTFFEMLGNFSFGQDARDSCKAGDPVCGYFKEEAIKLAHEFIVNELGLKIDYVTIFSPDKIEKGDWRKGISEDKESYEIWKKIGIPENRIKKEGVDNFWGPTGEEGPCGPTTEIYVSGIEIWNIVFNEFFCDKEKKLEKLATPGVDTGMGLERLAMVVQKKESIFETDLFESIIRETEKLSKNKYEPNKNLFKNRVFRIMADHVKSSVFLASEGILPSNIKQGYVLRKLIRRAIIYSNIGPNKIRNFLVPLAEKVIDVYPELTDKKNIILGTIKIEEERFEKILEESIEKAEEVFGWWGKTDQDIEKTKELAQKSFFLEQSGGLPVDLFVENLEKFYKEKIIFKNEFRDCIKELRRKHRELSRTASAGMFKGGLADHNPKTIRLHTAHHLLLAALQEVFGKTVKQKGSNINSSRLRIDFSFGRKLTDEEKTKIENIVNRKIKENLVVEKKEMPIEEAEKIGAEMEFGVKYANVVSVYFIKDKKGNIFSKEFCGGPHVKNTSELGKFKITKEESSGAGMRRIKAVLE